MKTNAIVIDRPKELALRAVSLTPPDLGPGGDDVVVDIRWSGVSTGTERLLWSGRMPPFPGLGYPLVPGYESVGVIAEAGPEADKKVGDTVFIPGAQCYIDAHGLFGGAAARLVTKSSRTVAVDAALGDRATLLALAATAHHVLCDHTGAFAPPSLIVGHGVLGRLAARLTLALGGPAPTVWESNPTRRDGAEGYSVIDGGADEARYDAILDVSGAADILDTLVRRLAKNGEIVLGGFYEHRPSFSFPPAFMTEARFRVAAEWRPEDMAAVQRLLASGVLTLDGLISHRADPVDAAAAYETAFTDADCLKMILDWSGRA
ncbi:MAG: chlorophyll synthesis pathway protein BchC [Alphaproteobacteria bacterium]|nr:chlorophyll synthesis pathway protein BchC [Alphaproteobacteria bacterium]